MECDAQVLLYINVQISPCQNIQGSLYRDVENLIMSRVLCYAGNELVYLFHYKLASLDHIHPPMPRFDRCYLITTGGYSF